MLIGAGAALVLLPAIAFLLGTTLEADAEGAKHAPWPVLAIGAMMLSYPVVVAGYSLLRNDELEPYTGKDLWIRGGICALIYAATWGIHAYLGWRGVYGDSFELHHALIALTAMIVPGALAGLATLDLDGFSAAIHYGFYLVATVLLRLIMGIGPL